MAKLQESKRLVSRTSNKKRTGQWIMSADVPTDIVVEAGGTSFSLHKFPLVGRCGRIRRAVSEAREADLGKISFPDLPGGPDTFELAAKFCYGISFDLTASNAAPLRCCAQFLDMRDELAPNNLISRSEAFISDSIFPSLSTSLTLLHSCQQLLPWADDPHTNLISRAIESIASIAARDQQQPISSDYGSSGRIGIGLSRSQKSSKPTETCWWAEELSILRIDLYQRLLEAMRSKGVSEASLWVSLMHYAQQSLKGVASSIQSRGPRSGNSSSAGKNSTSEHEQRIVVETIVILLPPAREKPGTSSGFLFGLLRAAIVLDTTVACRLEIERRIAAQLEQATLDDLLIPALGFNGGETLFDVEVVQRIVSGFLQQQESGGEQQQEHVVNESGMYESDGFVAAGSPSHGSLMKVSRLMDGYLAEIAPDSNLKLSKFVGLAELLPEYSRVLDDGLYRAVDIYLKAHPGLIEADRKKVCRLLNAQKLSQEACCHAAQNERLPAHFSVQVLYFEQVRIRNEMGSHGMFTMGDDGMGMQFSRGGGTSGSVSAAMSPRDNYSSLRRENRELKLEIARMRMRLSELEKSHNNMRQDIEKTSTSPNKLVQTVSRRLTRLNPFSRRGSRESDSFSKASEGSHSNKPPQGGRDRRHSYS